MSIALEVDRNVAAGAPIRGLVRATGVSRVRVFVRRTMIARMFTSIVLSTVHKDEEARSLTIEGPETQFELPSLRGPLSYVGERVELVWSVVAEALENDGSVADSAEMPITLGRPSATTIEHETVGGYREPPTETTVIEPVLGEDHVEGPRTGVVGPDADNAWAIIGSAIARAFPRLMRDRSALREVQLTATPRRVRPGESTNARVAFDVDAPLVVEGVTIELIAREILGGAAHHMPVLHTHEERARGRERLEPGAYESEARFEIPGKATPSFATAGIGVEWFLRATIPIDGQADVIRELVLTVAPF